MEEIAAKSYTLKNDDGRWLGQIVLTSDGMFASVTDWGNFSFGWRHFGDKTLENFENFIINLNIEYFADKMYQGFAYVCANKTIDRGTKRFAKNILPALQAELKRRNSNKRAGLIS